MSNFGETLKKLRSEKGLSYRRLSKEVDISHSNLEKYEKNNMEPSFDKVIKICKFFNVSIDYLILGDNADLKYNDLELAELFNKTDMLDDEFRRLVKKYIRKVVGLSEEKGRVVEEAE